MRQFCGTMFNFTNCETAISTQFQAKLFFLKMSDLFLNMVYIYTIPGHKSVVRNSFSSVFG